jgi:transcriptional regulator with XRE-family HTH domain
LKEINIFPIHGINGLLILEKIAGVFEVDITQLLKEPDEINRSIFDKVKLIDTLEKDEKNCLMKMIDIAIAKKKMKDNLVSMMSE